MEEGGSGGGGFTNEGAFDELVALGPREASRRLHGGNWDELAAFASALLERCTPTGSGAQAALSPPPDVNGVPFSTWMMWLATSPIGNEQPEDYVKRAQDSYGEKSNVCGRIWGKGYVAYRCRTCGMSPCSAICHECFEKGPHRTHNFLMYRSVAGGCCDCGDPGAWKSSGFCCDHKGPTEAFQLPLPEAELRAAYVTAHALVKHLANALTGYYERAKEELKEGFQSRMPEGYKALLELVQKMCVGGDVYRRIVCSAVLEDIGMANSAYRPEGVADAREGKHELVLLEALVRAGTHLSTEMSTLFLQMLFDFDFKREFTRVFIRMYKDFMVTILLLQEQKEIPTRMVDISVQLFSNSVLTVTMIREEKLLSTLFTNVLALCNAQAGDASEMTVSCEHAVWTKRTYWPITNDLVNILSHRAVVIEFLMDPQLVLEWLVVIQRFQAMDTHSRQQDVHIEVENRQWTSPFFIELELVMEQLGLLETGLMHNMGPDPEVLVDSQALIGSMQQILGMGIQHLDAWLRLPAAGITSLSPSSPSSPGGGAAAYQPVSYFVQSQPVTLHIPMHRFVAFFASQLCRHISTDILTSVFPSHDFVVSVMEHPLRIQVLLAQIRAGIWRWNGETMLRRAWFYRSSYFYDFGFDLDLFLLQCTSVLLDPETFLVTLLHRFNLVSVFGFASPQHPERDGYSDDVPWSHVQDPFLPTMAEDLLVLIGAVVSERARLGFTDRQCMEQEVVSRLCVRPHAHSHLTDNICRRWHEHDDFESVINEVADYDPPKSDRMEQGKYKLKKERVGQEPMHLIHILIRSFNHGDYEAALEQSKATPKDGPSSSSSSAARGGAKPLLQPAPGLFTRLPLILKSRVLHQILHHVLQHSLERREFSSSVQVHVALWLLQAALEQHAIDAEMGESAPKASDCRFGEGGRDVAADWGCLFSECDVVHNMGQGVRGVSLKRADAADSTSAQGRSGGASNDSEADHDSSVEGGEAPPTPEPEEVFAESQSIKGLLQAMLKSEALTDTHANINKVLKLYNDLNTAAVMTTAGGASQGGANEGGGEDAAPAVDAKTKAREAKERQAALLASFAAQQKQFADASAMLTDGDSDDEEMHERRHQSVECVICSVASTPTPDNPIGLVSLVQRSRLLASSHGKALHHMGLSGSGFESLDIADDEGVSIGGSADLNRSLNLHFQSCGHYIHLSCFSSYFQSLLQNERQNRTLQRDQQRIDLKRGLFQCPMCRQIANVLVPLLPDGDDDEASIEEEDGACEEDQVVADMVAEFAGLCEGTSLMSLQSGAHIDGERALEGWAWSVSDGGGAEMGHVLELFAKRLMHLASQDQASAAAGDDHHQVEYLRVLVNALGMTVACMELGARDPIVSALGVDDQVLSTHQRVLNVLYHVSRVALHERKKLEGSMAVACSQDAEGVITSMTKSKLPEQADSDQMGEGSSGSAERVSSPHPMRMSQDEFEEEVPLLCRDMYSTLVRLIYSLPDRVATQYRWLLLRTCYLAVVSQAFVSFHLKKRTRRLVAPGSGRGWASPEGALVACLRGELGGEGLRDVLEFDDLVLSGWLSSNTSGQQQGAAAAGGSVGDGGSMEGLLGECVRGCSHAFLRKAAMAYHIRFGDPQPNFGGKCGDAQWEELARNVGLVFDPIDSLPAVGEHGIALVKQWCRELKLNTEPRIRGLVASVLPTPVGAGFPLMVPLPDLYHDLYMSHRDQRCNFCREVPHRPALCLMCGELACFASECCRRINVPGASDSGAVSECFAHSVECGAGTGCFMLLKTSMVLLIRDTHWCIWGSPYLDAYGEEDPELKRGRPLHLNRERYQQLQLLHSTVGFDHNSRVASIWLMGAQRY